MTYQEVLENARVCIGSYCKACNICNGRACRNQIPGPGAKGVGDTAIRNYDKWQEIRVNMDTICENTEPDTSLEIFGKRFGRPSLRVLWAQWLCITAINMMIWPITTSW